MYLQFCSFELELSILQQGVVFLLTVFELMLFEFVWCYFLWRYLKIHGMEIESYCKIKRFLKRLQIALQIRILYFSTHHNTNKDMKYIQYEMLPKICYITDRIPWKGLEVAARCIFYQNFIHNLLKLVSLYNIQTLHNILASLFGKRSILQFLSSTISAGFH